MQYGEKITALRKSKSMTQAELGKELNVTFQAVSKWERDESLPDFETLSKIARLFNVPISYFEEDAPAQEEQADEDREETAEEKPTMLGVCTKCGKVVNEGDEAQTQPALVCKACHARIQKEKAAREKEEQERQRRMAEEKERNRLNEQAKRYRYRNRGLIWGAVIIAPLLLVCIICMIRYPADAGYIAITAGFLLICGYPFVAQLFWDGLIREMVLFGGKIVGMPGVIFSLDLDGIFFLIVVKILFAILRMLIFLVTLVLGILVTMVVAPFAFVPQLIKCSRHGEDMDVA